ncbi:MAG: MlaD family protein [Muribaculaceae bacterium]|nr:MlaD family protein [Muribaculaceae bacterium]MDE6331222.1 MlaD family protein [Muribaculaceae bacterium]
MKKIFRKEVIIGALVLVSMALLFFGIDFLKGVNVFKAANYYYATYDNVAGLAVSAPVTVNGYKVGQVREISYMYDNPGHVRVEVSLDKELKVTKGTKAMISSDILGTATIVLDMAPGKDYAAVGSELQGAVSAGLMDEVSGSLMPSVSAIFPKIDTLLTSLNRVVGDPAILASARRLDAITANLETATVQLNALMRTLPPVVGDVKHITENMNTVSADMAVLSTTLRQMPLDSTMQQVQLVVANLRQLSEELKNPDSTLGRLTGDPALYDNLNATVQSLDSLFVDIKKNPKRYISIKLL